MAPHTETDTMRSCILLFVSQRMFSGAVASSIGTQWPGQARPGAPSRLPGGCYVGGRWSTQEPPSLAAV